LDRGSKCDYFHLASHGIPISNFTDPFFASIRTKDMTSEPLSLPIIQKHFWAYPYFFGCAQRLSFLGDNQSQLSETVPHQRVDQFRNLTLAEQA